MMLTTSLALGALAVAALLCVARLIRPGSLAERIVAVDSLLVVIVSGVAVQSARTGDGV